MTTNNRHSALIEELKELDFIDNVKGDEGFPKAQFVALLPSLLNLLKRKLHLRLLKPTVLNSGRDNSAFQAREAHPSLTLLSVPILRSFCILRGV